MTTEKAQTAFPSEARSFETSWSRSARYCVSNYSRAKYNGIATNPAKINMADSNCQDKCNERERSCNSAEKRKSSDHPPVAW